MISNSDPGRPCMACRLNNTIEGQSFACHQNLNPEDPVGGDI